MIYVNISFGMNITPTPETILQQIARLERLEKGTLSTIRQTQKGPCCNFQRWENGRNVSEYIAAERVPQVRDHLQAHAQFEALVAQYVQLLSARSREQRLAEVEKKRRPKSSSSPKKRKSSK
jgi:hypothetical protein